MHYNRRGNSTIQQPGISLLWFAYSCFQRSKNNKCFNNLDLSPSHLKFMGWKLCWTTWAIWACETYVTPGWGCKAHLSLLANLDLCHTLFISWWYCKVIIYHSPSKRRKKIHQNRLDPSFFKKSLKYIWHTHVNDNSQFKNVSNNSLYWSASHLHNTLKSLNL